MSQIHLAPVPPYDFDLSARIFSRGDPAIRIYDNGVYRHALDIQGSPTLIEVRSIGTPDNPRLEVTATPGGRGPGGRFGYPGYRCINVQYLR